MCANTLEADTGNNCMYPKVLSLYETVISICIYPKVSSLYETVTYAMYYVTQTGPFNDPNGIYVINPNGASISINCMLQQLCPYRHAYLSLYQVLNRQSMCILCSVQWTRVFQRASPLDGRDSLFVLLENHLKNGLESPLIFVLF